MAQEGLQAKQGTEMGGLERKVGARSSLESSVFDLLVISIAAINLDSSIS